MKRFKLIAAFVAILTIASAFVSKENHHGSTSLQNWGYYHTSSTESYTYDLLDYDDYCDVSNNGAVCTIGGYTAYDDAFNCYFNIPSGILRRI